MAKFQLGRTVATRGVADELTEQEIASCIMRHASGDWGEMPEEDKKANDRGLKEGDRLMSAYTVRDIKVWVITEWDRSVTTVLFPSEY